MWPASLSQTPLASHHRLPLKVTVTCFSSLNTSKEEKDRWKSIAFYMYHLFLIVVCHFSASPLHHRYWGFSTATFGHTRSNQAPLIFFSMNGIYCASFIQVCDQPSSDKSPPRLQVKWRTRAYSQSLDHFTRKTCHHTLKQVALLQCNGTST